VEAFYAISKRGPRTAEAAIGPSDVLRSRTAIGSDRLKLKISDRSSHLQWSFQTGVPLTVGDNRAIGGGMNTKAAQLSPESELEDQNGHSSCSFINVERKDRIWKRFEAGDRSRSANSKAVQT
jgi:hypothetical protein